MLKIPITIMTQWRLNLCYHIPNSLIKWHLTLSLLSSSSTMWHETFVLLSQRTPPCYQANKRTDLVWINGTKRETAVDGTVMVTMLFGTNSWRVWRQSKIVILVESIDTGLVTIWSTDVYVLEQYRWATLVTLIHVGTASRHWSLEWHSLFIERSESGRTILEDYWFSD